LPLLSTTSITTSKPAEAVPEPEQRVLPVFSTASIAEIPQNKVEEPAVEAVGEAGESEPCEAEEEGAEVLVEPDEEEADLLEEDATEEAVVEAEFTPVILIPHDAPTKKRGGDLGKQTRVVVRPNRGAIDNVDLPLHDGTIYVLEFRQGRADVPQVVADFIMREIPRKVMVVLP